MIASAAPNLARPGDGHPARRTRTAIVLSGGGARAAYQAGLVSGMAELLPMGAAPFDVFIGSSAGAINAGMLAAHADDLRTASHELDRLWRSISPQQVFRTDIASLGGIGARWAWDLSFGGVLGHVRPKALLDTTPLRSLLESIPFDRLAGNIASGALHAFAVAATDLYTSTGVLFVDGGVDLEAWQRRCWEIDRVAIGVDHLMASSAIPIFFPSVEIGARHFGDGSIRNTAPLSPAIRLGADRIVAIGVQQPHAAIVPSTKKREPPTIAQIAGVLLDAVMLDAMEIDVEHSARVNACVRACEQRDVARVFHPVEVLWLKPSVDFGAIAAELSDRVPAILRYLMRGLGSDESITELLSYLLFDPVYCGRLVDLGRNDAAALRPEIERFFEREISPVAQSRISRERIEEEA